MAQTSGSTGHRRKQWAIAAAGVGLAAVLVGTVVALTSDDPSTPQPGGGASSPTFGSGSELPGGTPVSKLVVPIVPTEEGPDAVEARLDEIRALDEANAAGIRINIDIRWLCQDEQCDTGIVAPLVEEADARGMLVYLHVNSSPFWFVEEDRWHAPAGDEIETWAGLFAQYVEAFGTSVDGYEVWNEPNVPGFFLPEVDAGQYADLLKASYEAAKNIDPQVQIIGGNLSHNDMGYMRQLSRALAERGGNAENNFFYDKLGAHPYGGGEGFSVDPLEPAGTASESSDEGPKDLTFLGLELLRNQIHEDEGLWRDVVIGEFGYSTTKGDYYYASEAARAEYLVLAIAQTCRWEWVESITLYNYSEDPEDGFSIVDTESGEAVDRATTCADATAVAGELRPGAR